MEKGTSNDAEAYEIAGLRKGRFEGKEAAAFAASHIAFVLQAGQIRSLHSAIVSAAPTPALSSAPAQVPTTATTL